jgi:hypothetical protein
MRRPRARVLRSTLKDAGDLPHCSIFFRDLISCTLWGQEENVQLGLRLSHIVGAGSLVEFPMYHRKGTGDGYSYRETRRYFVWALTKEQTWTDGKAYNRLEAIWRKGSDESSKGQKVRIVVSRSVGNHAVLHQAPRLLNQQCVGRFTGYLGKI